MHFDELDMYDSLDPSTLTALDVSGRNLISLRGIENFGRMVIFNCSDNWLTDLGKLPDSIEFLYCSDNRIERLGDLPLSLKVFYCLNNNIKRFDRPLPPTLIHISYHFNPLEPEYIYLSVQQLRVLIARNQAIGSIKKKIQARKIQRVWKRYWYMELDDQGRNRFIKRFDENFSTACAIYRK